MLDNRQYRHHQEPDIDHTPVLDKSNMILHTMYHPYDDHEYGFAADPQAFEKRHIVSTESINQATPGQ